MTDLDVWAALTSAATDHELSALEEIGERAGVIWRCSATRPDGEPCGWIARADETACGDGAHPRELAAGRVAARELAALEAEFDAAGGRGVDLAERIDQLRALRDGLKRCERCGELVHNLSADGQCLTCIADGAEAADAPTVPPCPVCGYPRRIDGDEIVCGECGNRTYTDATAETRPARKRTVFEPCEHHAAMYAAQTRYRRAEVMVEGGWGDPCTGGQCTMRPGTDFYNADFVTANPVYTVGATS